MLDAHHSALASGKNDIDMADGMDHDQNISDVIGNVLDLLGLDTFGCNDDLSLSQPNHPSTEKDPSQDHMIRRSSLSDKDRSSIITDASTTTEESGMASRQHYTANNNDHDASPEFEHAQTHQGYDEPEQNQSSHKKRHATHTSENNDGHDPGHRDELELDTLFSNRHPHNTGQTVSHDENTDMDLDLEAAIGNAFASFGGPTGFDVKDTNSAQIDEKQREAPADHVEDNTGGRTRDPVTFQTEPSEETFESPSNEANVIKGHTATAFPRQPLSSIEEKSFSSANSKGEADHVRPEHARDEQSLEQDLSAAFDTAFEQAMKTMSQGVSPQVDSTAETALEPVAQRDTHSATEGLAHPDISHTKSDIPCLQSRPEPDHENLDAAIGDALKSVSGLNTSSHTSTNDSSGPPGAQADDALNQTIENIFGSLLDEPKQTEVPKPDCTSPNAEQEHADLDAAIGDAFKSVMGPESHPPPSHSNEDSNLEAAIAEAFSSINNDVALNLAPHPLKPVLRQTPSSSSLPFSSLTSSMSPYVKEILENSDFNDKEHAQEHAIQVLAKRIKSNFQDKTAPDNTNIREAPVLTTAASNDQDGPVEEDADLEELKMNEILLKAFNMAMENPEELILDLDVNMGGFMHNKDLSTTHQSPLSLDAPLRDHKASLPGHTFDSSASISNLRASGALNHKPKSIKETLAMHRPSTVPRKDMLDTSITPEGTSLLNSPLGIRISQAMSSVVANNSNSYREISESSILSVIKRMNSIGPYASALGGLALPELSLTGSTTVSEILKSLKNKPERSNIQRALIDAQHFLQQDNKGPHHIKVCSILATLFHDIGPAPSPLSSSTVAQDSIHFYSESIISTMASFDRFARDKVATDTESSAHRDSGLSRRVCNRERKKRWREGNTERNKDIDLRMRVTRRATAIHGEQDTPKKREWIENEFASRRQKRILRNGVEDDSDKLDSNARKSEDSIGSDPRLLVPINSLFNLLVKITETDIPEIAMTAISSTTAAAAAAYAKEFKLEFRAVNSAVTMLIANLMELNEHHQRVSAIARNLSNSLRTGGANASAPLKNHDPVESHLFSRITQTIKDIAGEQHQDLTQKRPYLASSIASKRSKVETDRESDNTANTSFIKTNADSLRTTSTFHHLTSTHSSTAWIPGAIKMPQYKPKELGEGAPTAHSHSGVSAASYASKPALSLPASSPFLSNKALGAKSSFKPGLRKPGSFQRPRNVKHETPEEHCAVAIPTVNASSQ